MRSILLLPLVTRYLEIIDYVYGACNVVSNEWWSCHSGLANPVQIVSTPPDYRFLDQPAMRNGWMSGNAPHKCGRCRGPPTTRKQVWICDICHIQIQVRKQISIRCNRIEHWVRLRCAGICLAQYTDTWTCHQHR